MNKRALRKAHKFAQRKHKGQKDDEGEDYFKAHVCQVVRILKEVTQSTTVVIAGYLHDTIEDTETTYSEIEDTFNKDVADLVLELTHEKKKDGEGWCFPRLKSDKARLIKFADRLSNLSRMRAWTPDRRERYFEKSKFWESE